MPCPPRLFFRNDDLGWDLPKFTRLLELFERTGHKLNAAAIPLVCFENCEPNGFRPFAPYLQVHAHGLAHFDHEANGKKSEFGPARDATSVRCDLERAFELTRHTFGDLFYPAFTPPWNRMETDFIRMLPEAGFTLLSRDGDKRAGIPALDELNIDIDLHTAKQDRSSWSTDSLFKNVVTRNTSTVGIMLHHKHMTENDYEFLAAFLDRLNREGIPTHFFSELAPHYSS